MRDLARSLVPREAADTAVWISLVYASCRADSLLAAVMILLQAEKVFPKEATIKFNLGCYACQRGDLATARKRMQEAIQLEPAFQQAAATPPHLELLSASSPTRLLPLEWTATARPAGDRVPISASHDAAHREMCGLVNGGTSRTRLPRFPSDPPTPVLRRAARSTPR